MALKVLTGSQQRFNRVHCIMSNISIDTVLSQPTTPFVSSCGVCVLGLDFTSHDTPQMWHQFSRGFVLNGTIASGN